MPPLPWRRSASGPAAEIPPAADQPPVRPAPEPYVVLPHSAPIGLSTDRQAARTRHEALGSPHAGTVARRQTIPGTDDTHPSEYYEGTGSSPLMGIDVEGAALVLAQGMFGAALESRRRGTPLRYGNNSAPVAPSGPTTVRHIGELPSHLVPLERPRTSHKKRVAVVAALAVGLSGAGVVFRDKLMSFLPGRSGISAESLVIADGAAIVNGKTGPLKDATIATFKAETTAKTSWNFTSPADPTKFNGFTDLPAENMFRTTAPWTGLIVLNAPYDVDPAK